MGIIIDDKLEREFRNEVAKRMGMKGGNIKIAVGQALRMWIDDGKVSKNTKTPEVKESEEEIIPATKTTPKIKEEELTEEEKLKQQYLDGIKFLMHQLFYNIKIDKHPAKLESEIINASKYFNTPEEDVRRDYMSAYEKIKDRIPSK